MCHSNFTLVIILVRLLVTPTPSAQGYRQFYLFFEYTGVPVDALP